MTTQADIKRGFRYRILYRMGSAAASSTALCVAFTPAFAQSSNTPGPENLLDRWSEALTRCMHCRQAGRLRAWLTGMWT